ncbi:MAG: hypothetical protein HYY04_07190 [Chloroflexi bacterium]|nr:hypothetical protein [Chloroflexota bacterium]
MACSSDSLTVIAETGHRWVLLSGIACSGPWPLDVIHTARTDEDELALVFRDDVLSNGVSFRSLDAPAFLVQLLTLRGDRTDVYAVTAMDAETFGHHHPGLETSFLATLYDALERGALPPGEGPPPGRAELPTRLADALGQGEIVTTGISELLDRFPRGAELVPQVSSWSTTADDLVAGNPFPLWSDPGNPLHRLQWEHTRLCIDLVQRAEQVAHQDGSRQLAEISRALLDRGLHSCQYWWGSRRPMWEPHMVHRGLMLQQEAALSAYRAIRASPAAEATKAESYYRVAAARDLANRLLDHLLET